MLLVMKAISCIQQRNLLLEIKSHLEVGLINSPDTRNHYIKLTKPETRELIRKITRALAIPDPSLDTIT